jgi:TonB-linked SusC/RagA family outer membrane protein
MKHVYTSKKIVSLLIVLFLALFSFKVMAQNTATVSGIVQNEEGKGLEGASVVLKNAKAKFSTTVATNGKGLFTFTGVPAGGPYSIEASYIGYESGVMDHYTLKEGNKISLVFKLKQGMGAGNDVVVIGYGSQKNREVTGAISRIDVAGLDQSPNAGFDQAIAGKAAGVQVYEAAGSPGRNNAIFRIRGMGSITAGTQPLIVLDGFPLIYGSKLNSINNADIASIDILKDAAAAAIYGSRGSNGVVLITTIKGSKDKKPEINFNAFTGLQEVTKEIDMMDAYQKAQFLAAAANNYWVSQNPAVNKPTDPNNIRNSAARIPAFATPYLNGEQGLTNTNWQDVIFQRASMQNYQLSIAGNSDKTQYYLSGNYFSQEGIVIGSGFKRYSVRLNLQSQPVKNFRIGVNINPTVSDFDQVSEGNHKKDGVVFSALLQHPNLSPYNADGTIARNLTKFGIDNGLSAVENPLALALYNKDNWQLFNLIGGAYAELDVLKNLTVKTYIGSEYYLNSNNYFHPSDLATYNTALPTVAAGAAETRKTTNYITEHTVNYNTAVGEHHFSVLAGYSFQKENYQRNNLSAGSYPNNLVPTLNAGIVNGGATLIEEWSLISYLARLNYNYANKYLLSASIRRDGSSRFAPGNKWGYFPSVSAGWRLKEENFLRTVRMVSEAKIRVSYGRTGNFFIPNYGYEALLGAANYLFNNTLNNGLYPSSAPNYNLSWEKSDMFNIGLDGGLFANKLTFAFDYYNTVTRQLLLNVPVPSQSGYSSSLQNIGAVRNSGVELTLGYKAKLGKLGYEVSGNIATNRNRVIELGPGQDRIIASSGTHITQIGSPIGSYYGYNIIGVFKSQEQLDQYPHLSTSKVGDYIYEDYDDNKKISDGDRKMLGKAMPDYIYGISNAFSYGNFSFSFLVQGVAGVQIWNQMKSSFLMNMEGWSNGLADLNDGAFKGTDSPGYGYAMATKKPSDKLYENSSYAVENGSFLRLRSASLGYRVPNFTIGAVKIKASVFVTGKNLLTITGYSGYNPEVSNNGSDPLTPGVDYGTYPVERSVIIGTKISF